MAIAVDSNTISVFRTGTRKKQVYMSPADTTRLSVLFDKLWASGSTITVTWDVLPAGNSDITISSETTTGLGTECYITTIDSENIRSIVECKAVNSGGETASTSFTVYSTQT
jgi:hypothetical protein